MNKKTPTQLMVGASKTSPGAAEGRSAEESLDQCARLVATSLAETLPSALRSQIIAWLKTADGAAALRECWPKVVDAYFSTVSRRATNSISPQGKPPR
jgi:hypothetical protein